MSKVGSFILGSVIGLGAGLVAASMLLPDDAQDELKKKIAENDKLQDLKEKYDKGTETIKTQLKSFPKSVEDDSELKDFDDIVIDDTKDKDDVASGDNAKDSVDDLNNAEKDDDTSVNTNSEA